MKERIIVLNLGKQKPAPRCCVWHSTVWSVTEVLAAMGTYPTEEGGRKQEGERKKNL